MKFPSLPFPHSRAPPHSSDVPNRPGALLRAAEPASAHSLPRAPSPRQSTRKCPPRPEVSSTDRSDAVGALVATLAKCPLGSIAAHVVTVFVARLMSGTHCSKYKMVAAGVEINLYTNIAQRPSQFQIVCILEIVRPFCRVA